METATASYEVLVNKAENFGDTANGLGQLIGALATQRDQITTNLEQLGTLLAKASDGLPKIEAKVVQLTEQITFGVKQNQDEMTTVLRDSAATLQSSVADVRNLLLEATQSANNQLNDHVRALADKTNEQIVKLDAALENELSKSISSLGRQLTALSKQFVEDYLPPTERLRILVQTGRGA